VSFSEAVSPAAPTAARPARIPPEAGSPALDDPRRQRERNGLRAAYAVLGVLLAAYVISELVRRTGQTWPAIDGWGVNAFEIVASGLCLGRAVVSRPGRGIALALGAGLLCWALGDVALTIESAGGATPPTPSFADGFYVSFYPLAYVAVMLLARAQVRALSIENWLDGAVAGLGAAAVCAAFAFHSILQSAGGGTAAVATDLVYPIGDLLLLALVVGGAAVVPARTRGPWLLLGAGTAMIAVGDTFNLFGSSIGASQGGTVLNAIAWPAATLVMSAAVWLPLHTARADARRELPRFVLPSLAVTAGLAILLVAGLHHTGHVALALAAATLGIAGIRFGLSLRGLQTLTEERHRQAVTDQLTNLGNRRRLFGVLDDFFEDSAASEAPAHSLAFLFVDLNGFKEINDSFGHSAGDELLKQLGPRMQVALRDADLFVRLGGDEFGVLLTHADAEQAAAVAGRLSSALEQPFQLRAVQAHMSASIGIAVAPTDADDAINLLRCADLAMYRAKLGRLPFAVYRPDLDGGVNRLLLVEELRIALDEGQLVLHYQPQVNTHDGEIVAVEALLRWPHPSLGFVPPLEFLPLAEDADLMGPLTALVLDQALAQCAEWWEIGQCVRVSVNISTTNLLDADFVAFVAELLERHRLPARALVLEITETTIIADFERSRQVIDELRDLGLIVSIDDFGAGFTSLAYLSKLSVGELKLDRTFIAGLASPGQERVLALVRSTIDLGHSLGMRVVAEGVEESAVLAQLADLGCELAQGYLISKPKPAAELGLGGHPGQRGEIIRAGTRLD
jgi:diguanylate cyclase (GGDEF)-like protein